jgi:serine/threonine protein kinase
MADLSPEPINVVSRGEPTDRTVAVSESEIFLSSEQAQDGTVQELREVLKYTHTIESLIGIGGMGVVYKVKNLGLDRYEAVKTFSHAITDDDLMRFQREARALSRVSDGNVVSSYNVSVLPSGVPFILMEYVNGSSLADIISAHHQLNPHWSIYMFCLIGYGLDAAHRVHVIHRDIKPENIIIFQDGSGRDFEKALAKDPRLRYENVVTMIDDLYRRHNSIWLRPPVLIPMDRTNVLTASRAPLPQLEIYVKQYWFLSLLCVLFLALTCLTSSYYRVAAAATLAVCMVLWIAFVWKVRRIYPKTLI